MAAPLKNIAARKFADVNPLPGDLSREWIHWLSDMGASVTDTDAQIWRIGCLSRKTRQRLGNMRMTAALKRIDAPAVADTQRTAHATPLGDLSRLPAEIRRLVYG